MKYYSKISAECEMTGKEMAATKRCERAEALKTVKRPCKELGFTAGMLKGALPECRNPRAN